MSHRTSYTPGTPCWVQLAAKDPQAAAEFYRELLGWTVAFTSGENGKGMFLLGGKSAAGIWPIPPEGTTSAWDTYVSTDDIDAMATRVEAAGGKVVVPPFQLEEAGKMAVFTDLEGAYVNAWQPLRRVGAGVVDEIGAYSWNELNTRDPDAAMAFYPQVFGWVPDQSETESYLQWRLDGRAVAGMRMMPPDAPAQALPYWLTYFNVADVDRSADAVKRAGGEQTTPFVECPAGRLAAFTDPWRARFALMSPADAR